MLDVLKGATLGAVAAALGGMGDVLEGIILVGAAGATLGWLYAKVAKPVAGGAARTYMALGALEDLPVFMRETRERLDAGSENFRALEERMARAEESAGEGRAAAEQAANVGAAVARELDVTVRGDPSDT